MERSLFPTPNMATAYKFQLTDGEVTNFLKDVEATGLHRKELDLKALHEEKPRVYGDQGSQKRRAFQKVWSNYRKKDTKAWIARKCKQNRTHLKLMLIRLKSLF